MSSIETGSMRLGSVVRLSLCGACLVVLLLYSRPGSAIVYVDQNAPLGEKDGSSWAKAFPLIQEALNASETGEEVWVAAGRYSEALLLGTGDLLFGGFEGYGGAAESDRSQRDWVRNETIIDASTAAGGSPALHAVTLSLLSNARLDGFTVTGGYANGTTTPDDSAAGIFLFFADASNLVTHCTVRGNRAEFGGGGIGGAYSQCPIENCVIRDNAAYDGAGLAWAYGSLRMRGCTVEGNIAGQSGGGVSGIECDSAEISDCIISGNEAPEGGAGIGFIDTVLRISDCAILENLGSSEGPGAGVFLEATVSGIGLEMSGSILSGNEATANPGGEDEGFGGGLYFSGGDLLSLSQCLIEKNAAQGGGGLYVKASEATVTISDCGIDQNTATDGIGGAALLAASVSIKACTLTGNSAMGMGGMSLRAESGVIENSILSNNTAPGMVGGAVLYSLNTPGIVMEHCTVSGNESGTEVGGIMCLSSVEIRNSIFEGNTKQAISEYDPACAPLLENCLFFNNPDGAYFDYSGLPQIYQDSEMESLNANLAQVRGCIAGDPAFVNKATGDFRISACSAAIDMGATVALEEDIDGTPRPIDIPGIGAGSYDIGAYELSEDSPLIFLQHPQRACLYEGDSAALSVEVFDAGCALSYQWKWEAAPMLIHDVGENAPTLALPDVSGREGRYWCELLYGGGSYRSESATLEVAAPITILRPPESQSMTVGESCTFYVEATGGYPPLAYVWSKGGEAIPEAVDASHTIEELLIEDAGVYTVTVLDAQGGVQSACAELEVHAKMPAPRSLGLTMLLGFLGSAYVMDAYHRSRKKAQRKKKERRK